MPRLKNLALASFAVLCLSGCSYGPTTKDKTFLESLNGKHYESGPEGPSPGSAGIPANSITSAPGSADWSVSRNPVLPIIKRRRSNVSISGTLSITGDVMPYPLAHQILVLSQNSQALAKTRTNNDGSFTFSGDFPDGMTTIEIQSDRYQGKREFRLRGFQIQDMEILVNRK